MHTRRDPPGEIFSGWLKSRRRGAHGNLASTPLFFSSFALGLSLISAANYVMASARVVKRDGIDGFSGCFIFFFFFSLRGGGGGLVGDFVMF